MIKYETVWGAGFGVWDEPLEGLTPDSTGRVLSFSYSRALLHTANGVTGFELVSDFDFDLRACRRNKL